MFLLGNNLAVMDARPPVARSPRSISQIPAGAAVRPRRQESKGTRSGRSGSGRPAGSDRGYRSRRGGGAGRARKAVQVASGGTGQEGRGERRGRRSLVPAGGLEPVAHELLVER